MIVIRIVAYLIGFVFGYDVMVLPYVLSDDVGIYKSFRPLVGYAKRDDNDETFWTRIFILLSMIGMVLGCILFWQYTSYCLDIIYWIYDCIKQWGFKKMEDLHYGTNQISYVNKNRQYMNQMDDI